MFVGLLLVGLAVFALLSQVALHTLAQPRVWPMFLLMQAGLFATLFTRFWQRGAETILAADTPIQPEVAELEEVPFEDAMSDPEPIAPSLTEPDPGVFRGDVHPLQ